MSDAAIYQVRDYFTAELAYVFLLFWGGLNPLDAHPRRGGNMFKIKTEVMFSSSSSSRLSRREHVILVLAQTTACCVLERPAVPKINKIVRVGSFTPILRGAFTGL